MNKDVCVIIGFQVAVKNVGNVFWDTV